MNPPVYAARSLAAWEPPARLGGAEWAERERVLSAEESPTPGPWRSVPWQREILDALADPFLARLVLKKLAQGGLSELVRCAIGRWAVLDPGDTLWVMTTELAAEKAMKKLHAMFAATPALRALVSPRRTDSTLLEMRLVNGMRIVIGWAGSPQSMASDPFRRVILDEVAKYPEIAKGEPPVALADERTKVFGKRGKVVLLSSPKSDDDQISQAFDEVSDRRVFGAPCLECGVVQPFEWESVRWPGGDPVRAPTDREVRLKLADEIERGELAWVECCGCRGRMNPQTSMVDPRARWMPETEDARPATTRRAYHVTELWHWETTTSMLAAKFLRAVTPARLQAFYNGSLARGGGHLGSSELASTTFTSRALHAPRVVPAWATTVLATADTQERGWWLLVRAWGKGGRSRLLDWGWVESEADLLRRTVNAQFEVEGAPAGTVASPLALAVDTGGGMENPNGSRTKQVYELVRRTPHAYALKGEGKRGVLEGPPWRVSRITFSRDFGEVELDLYLVNRSYYADDLARLVGAEGPILWEECRGAEDAVYVRQMTSEHRVLVTTSKGTKATWTKKSGHAPNHLWDCSRYQVWLAEFVRVEDRTLATWDARRRLPRAEAPREREGWVIGRD